MATMTPDGICLARFGRPGETLTVALGDRVLLRTGASGLAHMWTRRGVGVRLEPADSRPTYGGLPVLMLDCGDGDVVEIQERARGNG